MTGGSPGEAAESPAPASAFSLLWRLLEAPAARRLEQVRTDARYHSWELAELVLIGLRTKEDREPFARLLLALADHLPRTAELDPGALRWEAHRELGDWFRARGFLVAAELELMRAGACPGRKGPAERARYCHLLGRLRQQQGRPEEAQALLARAAEVFARCGRFMDRARALLDQGGFALEAEPREALACFDEVFTVGVNRLPPLLICRALEGMAAALTREGRGEEAERRLAESREIFRWEAGTVESLTLLAVEARLALAGGRSAAARELLGEAVPGLIRSGGALDAAAAAVLLATVSRTKRLRLALRAAVRGLGSRVPELPEEARGPVGDFVLLGGRLERPALGGLSRFLEGLRADRARGVAAPSAAEELSGGRSEGNP